MKAEDFLNKEKHYDGGCHKVYMVEALRAVDIAKEEVRELAMCAFMDSCQYQVNDFCEYGDCECDMKALYCANFRKKLYEKK